MATLEDAIREAAGTGRLHGLTLFFGSKGWQASARWNGNTGWTVEHDADPVAAALRALASTTRYDHAVEAAVAAPTASAGVFD